MNQKLKQLSQAQQRFQPKLNFKKVQSIDSADNNVIADEGIAAIEPAPM
jgi:hypothetical protein